MRTPLERGARIEGSEINPLTSKSAGHLSRGQTARFTLPNQQDIYRAGKRRDLLCAVAGHGGRKMKQWQRVLLFPVAALGLGLLTQAIFPGGFPRGDGGADDGDFPRVTWGETAPRVVSGEWLLVDARDEEHYAAQHIPGAISLPAHAYPEMLQFFAEDYGTDKTTVVYCGTEDCDVSTELAARLRDETGLSDVRVLEGGFLGWQRSQ